VSWKDLCEKLKKANDMDDVINANEEFLSDIYANLLLDGSKNSEQISCEIRSIFNLIVEITNLNQTFYKIALNEYEARKQHLERLERLRTVGDVNIFLVFFKFFETNNNYSLWMKLSMNKSKNVIKMKLNKN
jgi:nitrate reductase NapAB chaperone NapD